jgi:hypothetical protein
LAGISHFGVGTGRAACDIIGMLSAGLDKNAAACVFLEESHTLPVLRLIIYWLIFVQTGRAAPLLDGCLVFGRNSLGTVKK